MTAQEKIIWQEIDQVRTWDFDEGDEGEQCKARKNSGTRTAQPVSSLLELQIPYFNLEPRNGSYVSASSRPGANLLWPEYSMCTTRRGTGERDFDEA